MTHPRWFLADVQANKMSMICDAFEHQPKAGSYLGGDGGGRAGIFAFQQRHGISKMR